MNLTERIESVIISNLQQAGERKIGVECECFFYDINLGRLPSNQSKKYSAQNLLNELAALQAEDEIKAGYSLEPGGQLEWASPPLKSLHRINDKYAGHKARVSQIMTRENLRFIDLSLEPLLEPSSIELIDSEKYRLMDKMFSVTGALGCWMMRNTASIQVNIDYSSQEEAEKMAYIADCLTPLASILFANSPFWKGAPGKMVNLRYKIWRNTDNSRSGSLLSHGMAEPRGLINNYAQYIQSVPAIFIENEKGEKVFYNGTLGQWMKELEHANKLTNKHIQIALHQIFTCARFKNVLELRGTDRPPAGFELAPAAFWAGLLLDMSTQESIYQIVESWTLKERRDLEQKALMLDLKPGGPGGVSIGEWINILCDLALEGLDRRSKEQEIRNEKIFLSEYLDAIDQKGIFSLFIQDIYLKSGKSVKNFVEQYYS